MKSFITALTFMLMLSIGNWRQESLAKSAQSASTAKAPVSKELEREILKSEDQLRTSIQKRDVAALDKLLAEYYSDSYEGSEKAAGKRAVLEECRAGMLPFYRILGERTIEVRAEIVEIEGLARIGSRPGAAKGKKEESYRVKRLWTKNGGRWLLIAQVLERLEEREE